MASSPKQSDSLSGGVDVLAGLLALVFPGAGHFIRRERLRGVYIALGVLGLFLTGLLLGGIDAVDSREDRLWFLGQAFVGPVAFAVDWTHQSQFKAYDPGDLADPPPTGLRPRSAYPGELRERTNTSAGDVWVWRPNAEAPTAEPPSRKGLAKVNELAALITTLAGMLNFIAIVDALLPGRVVGRG
ncbi:MAG: DUF6677 family protein [Planctomycetota bacterium]